MKFIIGLILFVAALVSIVTYFGMKDLEEKNAKADSSSSQIVSSSLSSSDMAQGLKIEDIVVGTGKEVVAGSIVTIHYKGMFTDGSVFDESYSRGQPFQTSIPGQVIEGWNQGIIGMRVGGKRKLTIPPELAYGSAGSGGIPPNATLIFETELIDVQ